MKQRHEYPYRDGGIIAAMTNADLAHGQHLLPEPGRDQPLEVTIEHDTLQHGRVRVVYELKSSAHGKMARYWFWTPVSVTQVEPPGAFTS